jgi:hypothetical protein
METRVPSLTVPVVDGEKRMNAGLSRSLIGKEAPEPFSIILGTGAARPTG